MHAHISFLTTQKPSTELTKLLNSGALLSHKSFSYKKRALFIKIKFL